MSMERSNHHWKKPCFQFITLHQTESTTKEHLILNLHFVRFLMVCHLEDFRAFVKTTNLVLGQRYPYTGTYKQNINLVFVSYVTNLLEKWGLWLVLSTLHGKSVDACTFAVVSRCPLVCAKYKHTGEFMWLGMLLCCSYPQQRVIHVVTCNLPVRVPFWFPNP